MPRRQAYWAILAIALLALEAVVLTTDVGTRATDEGLAAGLYYALMAGACIAVLARAASNPRHRLAWGLIGLALAAWTAGDLYYSLALTGSGSIPYPSLSDAGYLLLYVGALAGLRVLGARGHRGTSVMSWGLATILLGLATLWSWLVYSVVIDDASGGAAAVATTLAYPLGDLVLLASGVLLVLHGGPKLDRSSAALACGFGLMAITDSIYAAQVASGTYVDGTFIEVLWPAAAILIAVAAWMRPRSTRQPIIGERLILALAGIAIGVAIAVQIVDHFTRLDTLTIVLSWVTLGTAGAQILLLHRDRIRALSTAAAAVKLRSASTEAALDCVISIDADGNVCEWNETASRTFGYRREDALGRDLAELIVPPDHRERHHDGLRRLAATGESRILNRRIEVMAMRRGGGTFPAELAITCVQDDPPIYTGFIRDISDRRRRQEENERLAAIVRSSEDAILSKDLGGLVTAWNEGAERLYGFTAEEAIGKPLSELTVPPEQVEELELVSESVIAGNPISFETKRRTKSGRVIEVALKAFPIRDLDGHLVGISTTAHDITERHRRETRERDDREGHLWRKRVRTALAEDGFTFWGQPVVDPRTGVVDHHELLLRMDLDGQTITPNHFLPHVEGDDLITEIDRWAVRRGVEHARTTPVAINLSARSLSSTRLMEDIKSSLADPELARNVTFEITETAAAENLEAARRLVEDLTGLGCGVALDDFGTGYGSFTYLKHLPVTELKIDIDFVRGLVENPADQRVVKSIISVAQNFGMQTVAEGVEDRGALEILESLGVDLVQGYLIGHPAQMSDETRRRSFRSLAPSARNAQADREASLRRVDPNAEVVRQLFEAISSGSPEDALSVIDPGIVWTPTAWSGARSFNGHEGVLEWMAQFGSDLSQLRIDPIEIEPHGEHVLVLGTVHDRRRGLAFTTRVAWLFQVEGGLIRAGQAYPTMAEARGAAFS